MTRITKIGKTATKIWHVNECIKVKYHDTNVVMADREKIILDTGGWFTNTTKIRMNQASNQFDLGFHVSQYKGEWCVDYKGETIKFKDNVLILTR